MATQDDLDAVRRTTGPHLAVLLLQLMLAAPPPGRHPPAGHAAAHASVPAVRDLTNRMTHHQTEESAALLQQLAAHRAQPLT